MIRASRSLFPTLILAAALMLCTPGCSRRQQPVQPPAIALGQTECTQCGMTINDERFAAAEIVSAADGEETACTFDDIGCLLEYDHRHADQHVLARYVKDFATRQWLAAQDAAFVRSAQIHSPMGYGLLAAANQTEAEKVRSEQGVGGTIDAFTKLASASPTEQRRAGEAATVGSAAQ